MGTVYRRRKYLADEYGISISTVDRRIAWILKHADRYPQKSVVHCNRITFVREDVFEDAIVNGGWVDAGLDPVFKEGKEAQDA